MTLYLELKDSILIGGFKEMVKDDVPNFTIDHLDAVGFAEIFSKGTVFLGGSDNKSFDYSSIIDYYDYNTTSYVTVFDTTTDSAYTSNVVDLPENGYTTNSPLPIFKADANKTSDYFKVRTF